MITQWYHYLFGFLTGVFWMNFLPHFINSIIGHPFPTPFADPPGRGLSSPVMNLVWALINLGIGSIFFYFSHVTTQGLYVWIAMLSGAIAMAFFVASYFGRVQGH